MKPLELGLAVIVIVAIYLGVYAFMVKPALTAVEGRYENIIDALYSDY